MKISAKLTLTIVSCIVLVSVAVGFTSIWLIEKHLLNQINARLSDASEFLSTRAESFVKFREKEINRLSSNRTIINYFSNPGKIDSKQIQDLLLCFSYNFTTLILIDKNGKEVLKINNSKIIYGSKNYNKILSNRTKIEENLYYTYQNENINNRLEDLYILGNVQSNNETIGIVAGKINYSDFYDILKETYTESGFMARIANNNTKSLLCGYPDSWDNNRLTSSTRIDNLGWTVETAIPKKVFTESISSLKFSIIIITLCIVIVASLLYLHFSHQIAAPIVSISKAAKTVSEGKYPTLIDIKSKDEIGALASSFNIMVTNLKDSHDKTDLAHQHAINMLAVASEYKSPKIYEHIIHIKDLVIELAVELGIDKNRALQIGKDCILHDLGKIGVPNSILLKPDKLTKEEFEIIKQHPIIGAKIIGDHKWFEQARIIAMYHHEKWDGSGYPEGLKGKEIPFVARIAAIADVFDVLVSDRPYKSPWKLEDAVQEIKKGSGKHFDPKIVDAFIQIYKQGRLQRFVNI